MQKNINGYFFGIGMLIFLFISIASLSDWHFIGSNWWNQYGALLIVALVIIGAVVGVVVASKSGENNPSK